MKVRCIALEDAFGKPCPGVRDEWLIVGELYQVLEIHCTTDDMKYRVLAGEDDVPILVSAKNFRLEDRDIPNFWTVRLADSPAAAITIGPKGWAGDFWVRYFDGDESAISAFDRELRRTVV
ncbi:MAG TPA: hypothetical protein VGD01_00855 [Candidatus Elarobacter sp.]